MIILKTNAEMKITFERLIKTMKEPVEWNGHFVVVGDYLILHGRVRSLFFNFESQKILTNIIDIPVNEAEVVEVENCTKVQNVLNLALYAFGKWGLIRGIRVDQDYAELNSLFTGVLREFSVEPGYSLSNFRFYKNGVRIAYEDVVMCALESEEDKLEKEEAESYESAGLWHKLVWKKQKASFIREETTFEERQNNRLGNNFYMVGVRCPKCKGNLHMTVFPEGEEFRIETSEGGVFMARAYTCHSCGCFYTPRPEMMLEEGEAYAMDFAADMKAYEDYLELLGAKGGLVSNYKWNEFEADRNRRESMQEEEEGTLEEICARMTALSDEKLLETAAKIEDGFYPVNSVRRFEHALQTETAKRRRNAAESSQAKIQKDSVSGRTENGQPGGEAFDQEMRQAPMQDADAKEPGRGQAVTDASSSLAKDDGKQEMAEIPIARREATKKRYQAKCGILNRLSPSQVAELKNDLLRDINLYEEDKRPFLDAIEKREQEQKKERIHKLAAGCKGESYAKLKRVIEEIEKTEVSDEEKSDILIQLKAQKRERGETEALELLQKMPQHMDLKQYQDYMERLRGYPEADLSPYESLLEEKRRQAENREIANMIRNGRMTDRKGITDLMERIKSRNFEDDIVNPYLKKLDEKLFEADEKAIEEICGNTAQMSSEDVMEAYRKIEAGAFLPELKTNALEMLKKRIIKLKTDECELLVSKLRNSLVGRIKEYDRYHYYPARKVMTKDVRPEEIEVIQFALDTYGTTRGEFEYPILVVDTSKDHSGKEGMILTPEHLFYRTMLNAYVVSIGDIRRIHSQTGLFNAGLSVEMPDKTRIKIPYAVEKKELTAWGNCLEEFIHYLQEKPDSRRITYLEKEKHETICCFRCGYTYKVGNVCPKCGYKMNQ